MTSKPILKQKTRDTKTMTKTIQNQLDALQGLLDQLHQQEQALEAREQELKEREEGLAQREVALQERTRELEQPTPRPRPVKNRTLEKPLVQRATPRPVRLLIQTLEETVPTTPTTSPVSSVSPLGVPLAPPPSRSAFSTSKHSRPTSSTPPSPKSSVVLPVMEPVQPFSSFIPSVTPETQPVPFPLVLSTASKPASQSVLLTSEPSPKSKKKAKKKELSPLKEPGAWLKEHRRGIITWFAATVGAATLTNYFAYLGREAVANKFAREANILQTQSIAINADPNRPLRDKLFAEDGCRTVHAYTLIVKKHPAFVRQTATRQLYVLALDPQIRNNLNRIARGQVPVTTGVCHLFR